MNSLDKKEIKLREEEFSRINQLLENAEKGILDLKDGVRQAESNLQVDNKKKFKNFLSRLDVSAGLNVAKVIFWIGMADAIIFLSADINAEIISACTYFLGIIFDMLLLRKHLPKDGTSLIHLGSGILILLFCVCEILLILGLAAGAMGISLWLGAKTIIDFAMPISGLCSTILEVIDSVGKDD